jgi:ribulose-phosphate 3-epimerase
MKKYAIAPSILSADFTRLGEEIAACESASADWLHIDVMDGHFVPNITMGSFIVEACRRATNLPLDVHLMIEKPERHLEAFAKAGASRLNVHVEACPHLYDTLQQIKALGCEAGIALNPDTPVRNIEAFMIEANLILVMSVYPGFSGQEFIPGTIEKVAEVRKKLDALSSPAWIQVDGGVTAENISEVKDAGATAFVAATAVFKHPQGAEAGIKALRNVIVRSERQ